MKNQTKRINRQTLALVVWAGAMAAMFAAGAGGCSTVMGAVGGAMHGATDDWDSLTDKLAEDKSDRENADNYRHR